MELSTSSGQLHIFFGAAPGVGKTWAMVDAAQQQRAEGRDVVIGDVDTHDRPEFSTLLADLETIAPLSIEVGGIAFSELDIDAIVLRKPDIVLIDELQRSNVPGSRRTRRYQDVVDLLQAGITVYTTLNVQHVASVAKAVTELTGIEVREQVPDFILEMASSIRLIDLAPTDLLNRLLKRVHGGDALDNTNNLFRPANLMTLREIALRIAAARSNEDVRRLNPTSLDNWATSSRILVGISASPSNVRILRAAQRLAAELHTTWIALHVDTSHEHRLDDESQARIKAHKALAQELGAELLSVAGDDVPRKLVEVAEQYGVTRIVIGRTKKRGLFSRAKSLAEDIIDLSETLDVVILSGGS
jgi:two-component system sensor histidine kinase KdpD